MQEQWLTLRGPQTRPRASYNKIGIGQVKQIRGNPVTWNIDCMGNCWPLLSLRGGQDPASQALRQATVQGLKPRRNILQSRGVIGIVERADGSGGSPQSYTVNAPQSALQQQAAPDPAPSSTNGGSSTPSSSGPAPCPDGMYRVYISPKLGWSSCKKAFGT